MRVVTLGRLGLGATSSEALTLTNKLNEELRLFESYEARNGLTPAQQAAFSAGLDALDMLAEQGDAAVPAARAAYRRLRVQSMFCIPSFFGANGCPREGVSSALFGVAGLTVVGLAGWGIYSWWRNR